VPTAPLHPQPIDLDIFREMYRGSIASLSGIDPRLNASAIARRLHTGRARVAHRLQAWSDSGFLVRFDVWLNPALFGWQGAFFNIRLEHPRTKPALIGRLALLEGAVSSVEFLGEWITFGAVAPDAAGLERQRALVGGLAGVREVEPPMPWGEVRPQRALSPLDVRIVRALREAPTATLRATATRVGISTRTMTRRYAELVGDWAAWFVPVLDFRAITSPLVSLLLTYSEGATPATVARQVRARYPLTLAGAGVDAGPPRTEALLVMPSSSAHLEELEQFVAGLDGVVGVETNVMVRMHSFPTWFDRQLAGLAPASRR